MMGLIWTVVVGLVAGGVARFLMPGENKMGWMLTVVLGVAGSVVAGQIGQLVGWYKAGQGAGFIGSVVGAALLLFVVGKFKGGAASGPDNKGGPGGGKSV